MKTPKRPYAGTPLTLLIEKRILELKGVKSQVDVSSEAGFPQPAMLAMIKAGTTKLPLDRVPGLARALDIDPARLMQLALEQLGGDTVARALIEVFGTVVTKNEVAWLNEIRHASGNVDPALTSRARSAIRGIFGR